MTEKKMVPAEQQAPEVKPKPWPIYLSEALQASAAPAPRLPGGFFALGIDRAGRIFKRMADGRWLH